MKSTIDIEIIESGLVLLVGTAGSGKSTFAKAHFAPTEVVSSDRFRELVCDDPADQSATADAFELVHALVEKRLQHHRLAVVDATNVEAEARLSLRRIAKALHVPVDALVLDLPVEECIARDAKRAERSVGEQVVREHRLHLDASLRRLADEGFRAVHRLESTEDVDRARIVRMRLANDRREVEGPFDIIGDVHGCADELRELLARLGYDEDGAHPDGRRVVFLGDLVDRGPKVSEALSIAMHMVREHGALCVQGNHEAKVLRWLEGRKVKVAHGLEATIEQLEREDPLFRERVRAFLESRPDHLRLANGALVVAHAGLKERLHGRSSKRVRAFCLYGDTTGETDDQGLPVRLDWAQHYRGEAEVVYGHTPTLHPQWVNGTICIDTGCVFGGGLTALRWPERELIHVSASANYYARPTGTS